MNKLLNHCPSCGGQLVISEVRCPACDIQIRGQFAPPEYSVLSEDQLVFIQVFLRARGNLSEVERALGVSYPTIRNKLDEINNILERNIQASNPDKAIPPADPETEKRLDPRRELLRRVAEGSITPQEADRQIHESQEQPE